MGPAGTMTGASVTVSLDDGGVGGGGVTGGVTGGGSTGGVIGGGSTGGVTGGGSTGGVTGGGSTGGVTGGGSTGGVTGGGGSTGGSVGVVGVSVDPPPVERVPPPIPPSSGGIISGGVSGGKLGSSGITGSSFPFTIKGSTMIGGSVDGSVSQARRSAAGPPMKLTKRATHMKRVSPARQPPMRSGSRRRGAG